MQAAQIKSYEVGTVLYMAMELSNSRWKLGFGNATELRRKSIEARDRKCLLAEVALAMQKLKRRRQASRRVRIAGKFSCRQDFRPSKLIRSSNQVLSRKAPRPSTTNWYVPANTVRYDTLRAAPYFAAVASSPRPIPSTSSSTCSLVMINGGQTAKVVPANGRPIMPPS